MQSDDGVFTTFTALGHEFATLKNLPIKFGKVYGNIFLLY